MTSRASLPLTALAGGLLFLAQGLHPCWWAAWLAPLPLLIAAAQGRAGRAFMLGGLAGLIGSAANGAYYWGIAGPGLVVFAAALQALSTGAAVALAAAALLRWRGIPAVWVFPLAQAGIGFLTTLGSPNGTAGSLAYSQMAFLPALQVASLGGTAAVVILIAVPASAVAVAFLRRPGWRAGLAAGLVVTALALGWGTLRLRAPAREGVTVALLATDHFAGIPKGWDRVAATYLPAVDDAIAAGARIVVLPEKIVVLPPAEASAATAALAAKAKQAGVTLVMGALWVGPGDRLSNRALVALPDGQVLSYDKQHLVPGWEASQTPGHGNLMLPAPQSSIGVAICKDFDFAQLGRDYSNLGARLMLAPAWDFSDWWGEDGYSHGRIGVLRAVEGGFTLARAARQGRLTLSDRYGRVLAEAQTNEGMSRVLAVAPLAPFGRTLYARIGDAFGYFCVASSLAILAALLLPKPRRS